MLLGFLLATKTTKSTLAGRRDEVQSTINIAVRVESKTTNSSTLRTGV
jgi:hypothetical protein